MSKQKRINQAAKNNPEIFPSYALTDNSTFDLKSKFSTSNLSSNSRVNQGRTKIYN